LKIHFTAEVLPIGILEPSHHELFVGEIECVFEIFESDHESSGQTGRTVVFAIEAFVCFIEAFPLDCVGELDELMIQIDLVIESCLKELDWRAVVGG